MFLRHTLAALAYRANRALDGEPPGFSEFRPGPGSRSAGEILAHLGDLLEWAARLLSGERSWEEVPPSGWDGGKDRFFAALTRLDQMLQEQGEAVPGDIAQRLFQGPIADALTHVGQLAMMRGMAGAPVKGENYFVADIAIGRTTQLQSSPKRTF